MPRPPPAWLVTIVNRLIPPPSREAVLGDLWEGYRSPGRFLRQGLAVVPFLVFAQVRRRSSWPILGLQAFILFACLRGFQPAESWPAPGLRAALPTLFAFLALAWHDAYRVGQEGPAPRFAWGEVAAVILAIALSQLATAAMVAVAGLPAGWMMTWPELLFAAAALPVICLFRWGPRLPTLSRASGNLDLVGDYERFRSSVRRRNRLEIGAMAATLLISGTIVWRADGPVSPIVWLTLFGFAVLLAYLVRRGGAPAPAPAASREEIRRLFCSELVRQHKLRSMLVWWWLTPLLIGLAMHFLLAADPATLQARQIIGILLILALGMCIHGFNAERAAIVVRDAQALSAAPAPNARRR